jgi:peroxiredoxin
VVVLSDEDGEVHRAYGVVEMLAQGPRVALFVVDGNGDVAAVFCVQDPARAVPLAVGALDLAR